MQLHTFPADRIVRQPHVSRSDAVAVTHHGMTKVYDCPADLHAAVLVACARELEVAEAACARRAVRAFKARLRAAQVRRQRALIDDVRRTVCLAAAAGAAAAVLVWGLGL